MMGSTTETKSISDYVAERGITCEIVRDRGAQVQDGWEHHAYVVKLTDPTTGATIFDGHQPDGTPILIDFEDWAGEFGYDSDSRKAEATYRAVAEQIPALLAFLGGVDEFARVATEYDRL